LSGDDSELRSLFHAALAHQRAGQPDEAARHYRRVLALRPDLIDAHLNLGAVLKDQGKLDEAAAQYRRALAVDPDFAEAHYNLGLVLKAQGQAAEAASCYRRALDLRPDDAAAHSNLGVLLTDQGLPDEAETHCRRAVELRPDVALTHHNLAIVLKELGRLDDAAACCRRALEIDPRYAAALNTMGIILKEKDRLDDAAACFGQAVAAQPDFAEAHYNLGGVLKDLGRLDEAVDAYRRVLSLKPKFAAAKFALCMAQLPPLYDSDAEIDTRRVAYHAELKALSDDPGDLANGVGASQSFYLAYQGRNDRELQGLYGELVCRAMEKRYPPAPLPDPPARGERLRVGMVSGYFHRHANWNIPIKGWLTQLDREKFELFGYYTGRVRDDATDEASALCARFVMGRKSAAAWREAILADRPHVLIYPEIGMDPMAVQLAAQRLARVQCVSWGHPDTSGLPTVDYYLGSDLMEPPGAQDHYTERLVRLPNLSVYIEPAGPAGIAVTRAEIGFREGVPVYWCGQSLYKYLPEFDSVFPRIAQQVGDCQFVFIEFPGSPQLTAQFRSRLRRAFSGSGLDADRYCTVLPRLAPDRFRAAMGQSDIVLDSIGWSGCNSLLDGLAYDLPIVTLPGPLIRGRHGAAILSRMGMDTVAADIDAYVALAAALGRDSGLRADIRRRISENKHRLYHDDVCIAGLEAFLLGSVAMDLE
jgi:predicted O-linked N-acetylglucosamine transferase (SPINDLY family)